MRDSALVLGAAVAIGVVLILGVLAWAMVGPGVMAPGMMWSGMMAFGWLLMLLFAALIVGGAILLVMWVVRQAEPATARSRGPRAMEILAERYARGEIPREQYEQMRRDLEES